jgi:hypothetical protein
LNGAVEKAVVGMKVKMYELTILHLGPGSISFISNCALFPFDSGWWFGTNIVNNSIHAANFRH